jgi:hypothetical protein
MTSNSAEQIMGLIYIQLCDPLHHNIRLRHIYIRGKFILYKPHADLVIVMEYLPALIV